MDATLDQWEPWSVEQAGELFAGAPIRWWISGGHALELHTGDSWRSHEDLDVGVCSSQVEEAYGWLGDWELYVAAAGRLTPWDGRPLDAVGSENNVWAREAEDSPWRFDLTVGPGTTKKWLCRRDQSVTRPWDQAVLKSPSGIPYLAPDLQLLLKAKHPRTKDHIDAERVIPALDSEALRFLAQHLSPQHPWQSLLTDSPPAYP